MDNTCYIVNTICLTAIAIVLIISLAAIISEYFNAKGYSDMRKSLEIAERNKKGKITTNDQ